MKAIQGLAAGVILMVAGGVVAEGLPARKPGLWEINMNAAEPNAPQRLQKVCLDPVTDQLLYKVGAGASQKLCNKLDVRNSGGKVVVDSECHIAGSTATSHSVTTFSGDTAYHTDVRVHYEPAMFGRTDSASIHEARWIGECPSDMRPGDVLLTSPRLPTPMRMNLNEIFNATP